MKRIKLYINGFEWWLDKTVSPPKVYLTETCNEGVSIYSKHFTLDENRQVSDFIKYGKNNENG
jgi:hypothetical protein